MSRKESRGGVTFVRSIAVTLPVKTINGLHRVRKRFSRHTLAEVISIACQALVDESDRLERKRSRAKRVTSSIACGTSDSK